MAETQREREACHEAEKVGRCLITRYAVVLAMEFRFYSKHDKKLGRDSSLSLTHVLYSSTVIEHIAIQSWGMHLSASLALNTTI